MEKDERKVKENNARKSVLSEQKWSNAMWNSILEEGETDKIDNVNIIQIPSKSTINLEPKAPPGYTIKEFGPMDQKNIFEELLSTAVKAYKMTAEKGRNMSSMMTPITLVGEKKESNIKLAEKLK